MKKVQLIADMAERLQKGEKVICMCAKSESKNKNAKMLLDYLKHNGMDESLVAKVEYQVAGYKDGMNFNFRFNPYEDDLAAAVMAKSMTSFRDEMTRKEWEQQKDIFRARKFGKTGLWSIK